MELVVVLLVIGAVLMLLEVILPGMIAGIVGFGCLVIGVVLGYQRFGAQTGSLILVIVIAGLVVGFACWVKYFPDSSIAQKFVTHREIGGTGVARPELVNQVGTAFTPLRPSGTALIQGERVDVVSEGGLIPRGTPIKVVAVEGMRVVVRACPADAAGGSAAI